MFLPAQIILLFLMTTFFITQILSLQCSTESGPIECNHSYNPMLNESSCAIWWSASPKGDIKNPIFQLPPLTQACISEDDFTNALPSSELYSFDGEKCVYQKYLSLAGYCFCKTGDFCNGQLLNDTAKLNDLLSEMEPYKND